MLILGCENNNFNIHIANNSFYYWRTTFDLSDTENNFLESNNIEKLYIRFFDVGIVNDKIEPIGKIFFNEKPLQNIVPVVFIKNDVFYQNKSKVDSLPNKVFELINKIASYNNLQYSEIQIDCDWSKTTKDAYFNFLNNLKHLHKNTLSATIRLHQIKYPETTGVPNVDYGVLMYYNMGKIDADDKNSIYDREIALQYLPAIANYKLPLSTALPIFSWLVHSRNSQVQNVIPKPNIKNIENLKQIKSNIFEITEDTFYQNYTFKKGDILKFENVPASDIKTILKDINTYSTSATNNLIWYDLDEYNIQFYKNEKLFN